MSYESIPVPQRIENVRTGTIAILENLNKKAKQFALSQPPSELEDYRRQLAANDYQVLVVGEAKRGKSSFINALIGRKVLPTDADIATCQVFRVRRAPQESYRVRYEDDTTKEIAESDLPLYGSQAMADAGKMPGLDKIIRWIEVDFPTHFLPNGVSILDTPGLGSLYHAHAQITHRFVPYADAVIFVLDSIQPIIHTEEEFIETILGITPSIFFIQTKIDGQRRDAWQTIQRRNQARLQERFQGRLTDTRIWPVSSTNLLKAIQPDGDDDEDYLRVSRYRELAAVLQVFLFHNAGWDRAAKAIHLAENYYIAARKTLVGRYIAVTEESEQKRTELQQRITKRKRYFDTEWGTYGKKQEELMETVRKVTLAGRQSFVRTLQQGNNIEKATREKIDGLKSLEEAKQYHAVMDGLVISAYLEQWHQVCKQTHSLCSELLADFLAVANSLTFAEETTNFDVAIKHSASLKVKDNWSSFKEKREGEGSIVESVVGLFLPKIIADAAAVCWAGIRTWFVGTNNQLNDAKDQLHQRLDDVLQSIRQKFLEPDLAVGYQSRVDRFFSSLERAVSDHIKKIAARKSMETQAELDRLSEEGKMDEQERKARADYFQQQLVEWDATIESLKDIVTDLKILDQLLGTFSANM